MTGLAPRLIFYGALMLNTANLNAAPVNDPSVINFPPNSAQKWVLPNGLTIIVKEDHSAPVASVQAWCATGSIEEDDHLGAGLSHILDRKSTRLNSSHRCI